MRWDARGFAGLAIGAAMCLALCLAPLAGCGDTPQLGGDDDCLAAADALWTAIGAKRADLVDQSAREIDRLHTAAKMNDEAFDALSAVVVTARAGEWSDARAALKSFVQGQRRAPK